MSDKKKSNGNKQHKDFDRIFRENAIPIFLPLIEMELDFKIKFFEALPAELPKTIDRDVDALYKIKNELGKLEILHIEFQTKNDPAMLERTAEYHGMIYRKYKLPIRHVVIFLGKGKAKMKNQLPEDEIFRGFDLINLHELDAEKLLSSQVPEVILLALLADFEQEHTEAILRLLVKQLKTFSKSPNDLKKYLNQLLMLSKLRKLEFITDKIIKDMPITYNRKEHFLYQEGMLEERKKSAQLIEQEREKIARLEQKFEKFEQALEEERKKSKRAEEEVNRAEEEANRIEEEANRAEEEVRLNTIMGIKQLLELGNLEVEQIASIMSVDAQFVEQIKSGEIS